MKRIIKDYTTITKEQLQLISDAYPDGIDSEMLISFVNAKGEYVKALEVRTDDTIFLFKISAGMLAKIDDHTDDDFDMGDFVDDYDLPKPESEDEDDDKPKKKKKAAPKKKPKSDDDDEDDFDSFKDDDDDDDDYDSGDDSDGDDDDDDDDF